MEECIFLSAHLPSPFSKQAGQRLAYNRLSWLSNHYTVNLITFQNESEKEDDLEKIFNFCREFYIYPIDKMRRLKNLIGAFNEPLHIAVRNDKRIVNCVKDILARRNISFVWMEYEQMAYYLQWLKDTPSVVVCHDALSQMYERKMQGKSLINFFYRLQFYKTKKWEKNIVSKCDAIVTLSEKDRQIILQTTGCSKEKCFVSFPKVTRYKSDVLKNNTEKDGICFFGAMSRDENIEAVKWFLDNIWISLKKKNQKLKFYIIGSSPDENLIEYTQQYSDVIVTGFVDNPANIMGRCFFSVAPLFHGAGVKIKVIECMEQGLPVITTQVGAEGIYAKQENGLFITNQRKEYLKFCQKLLESDINSYSLAASRWFTDSYECNEESENDILDIVNYIERD